MLSQIISDHIRILFSSVFSLLSGLDGIFLFSSFDPFYSLASSIQKEVVQLMTSGLHSRF